jgi:hypothetical protein
MYTTEVELVVERNSLEFSAILYDMHLYYEYSPLCVVVNKCKIKHAAELQLSLRLLVICN